MWIVITISGVLLAVLTGLKLRAARNRRRDGRRMDDRLRGM